MNLALAVRYGTNESLFLTNLCFWMEKNKANRVNYHDGHYWVYNTMEAWAELFPYFSKDQIRRLINKMKSQEILLVGVYNRVHYDRTQWYSVNDEVMALYLGGFKGEEPGQEGKKGKEPIEPVKEAAAICPGGQMDAAESPHGSGEFAGSMWRIRHNNTI
jgi:hypothetical protein